MNDNVKIVSRNELNRVLINSKDKDAFIVEIDGKAIQDEKSFIDIFTEKFHLPKSNNWDAIYDWLTDLNDVPSKNIIIIIFNYKQMMKHNKRERKIAFGIFEHMSTFWEHEVTHVVVGGEKKKVITYLVD